MSEEIYHFLDEKRKIKRLRQALLDVIEMLVNQGTLCPNESPYFGKCMYPCKECVPSEMGFDCWEDYLLRPRT